MVQIAVLGAGIVGMSTAVNVAEVKFPGVEVTLISDLFTPDTTSDGAAGCFGPRLGIPGYNFGTPLELFKKWSQDSFTFFDKLARSAEAREAGVMVESGYNLFTKEENIPKYCSEDIMYQYRSLTEQELKIFPSQYKFGSFCTTLVVESHRFLPWLMKRYGVFKTTVVVESSRYLPWLMKRFEALGGKVVQKKVKSIEELVGEYHLVVNCTGLGSCKLFNDTTLIPMRGQIMRVKAPWIKHFYFTDQKCYIFPCGDDVVVGGVKQTGNWNTDVNEHDRELFWKNCLEIVPSLKDAEILHDWVGLRPLREPIRIEKDVYTAANGRKIPVIHNYGHGASGIGLSWGTSVYATELVKQALVEIGMRKMGNMATKRNDRGTKMKKSSKM